MGRDGMGERTLVVCRVLCDCDHFDEHIVCADFGHWVVLYRDLAILYAEYARGKRTIV